MNRYTATPYDAPDTTGCRTRKVRRRLTDQLEPQWQFRSQGLAHENIDRLVQSGMSARRPRITYNGAPGCRANAGDPCKAPLSGACAC